MKKLNWHLGGLEPKPSLCRITKAITIQLKINRQCGNVVLLLL